MPAGNQSLQQYIPTVNTTQSATAYKANLDGNSSIVGNPAAMFYVYPQTPATMSVNIDKGFTYNNIGNAMVQNNGAGPATLLLTNPGSGTYYGTIYYDTVANTFGVTYAPINSAPIMPNALSQIPLAIVLINVSTPTIQATNLTDVRGLQFAPWGLQPGTLSTATAYNVMGASRVDMNFAISAALTLTLNNLSQGAPVSLVVTVSSGGPYLLKVAATAPSGAAYAVTGVTGAAPFNLAVTGYNVPNASTHCIELANIPTTTLLGPII